MIRKGKPNRNKAAVARYHRVQGTRQDKLARLAEITSGKSVDWTELETSGSAAPPLREMHLGLVFQQLLIFFLGNSRDVAGDAFPVSPSVAVLERRWQRFVSTADVSDRVKCFAAAKSGRNIYTKVAGQEHC